MAGKSNSYSFEVTKSHRGTLMSISRGVMGLLAGLLSVSGIGAADDRQILPAQSGGSAVVGEADVRRVSVDGLFAPIGTLRLQPPAVTGAVAAADPRPPALDELISQQLAADTAAAYLGEQRAVPAGQRSRPLSAGRNPYAFRHQPLYFSQPAMEVSGQSMIGLNPFITVGWFAVDAALLPVRLVTQPPCSRVSSEQ